MTLIDLNQIFPMKTSEFEISLSAENYVKKNENSRNFYDTEKRIVSTLPNISIPKFS